MQYYPQTYQQNYQHMNNAYQNPFMYPQQSYQQNQQSYQQSQPSNSSINWVQGEVGAKAYPVAPGNSILLMDSDDQCFYIKSADTTGMPSLRKYAYYEVIEDAMTQKSGAVSDEHDTTFYAGRDEVKALEEEIQNLKEELSKMKTSQRQNNKQQNGGNKNA